MAGIYHNTCSAISCPGRHSDAERCAHGSHDDRPHLASICGARRPAGAGVKNGARSVARPISAQGCLQPIREPSNFFVGRSVRWLTVGAVRFVVGAWLRVRSRAITVEGWAWCCLRSIRRGRSLTRRQSRTRFLDGRRRRGLGPAARSARATARTVRVSVGRA